LNTPCEPYRLMMLDWISGSLDDERCCELRQHLDGCSDCRAYCTLLQNDDKVLTTFTEAMQTAVLRIETSTLNALRDEVGALRPADPPGWGAQAKGYLKIAAVVAVVCLVIVAASHLAGPFRVSSVSLAQTLETMRGMSWVHTTETSSAEPGVVRECWECFDPHIVARKAPDRQVEYLDYAGNAAYRYNPNSGKITVSLTTDNYMPAGAPSPFEILSQTVDSAVETGAQVVRQPLVEEGRRRERIQIVFEGNPRRESVTFTRDVQRNLLVRMETVEIQGSDRPVRVTTFDYPQPGPPDIYALGAPQDASIFDTRPEGAALTLIDEVQRRFEQGFGDHLAVVLESRPADDGTLEPYEIVVLRQKGTLKRSDHYRAFNVPRDPCAPATLYPRIKDIWPSLTIPQVLALESDTVRDRQMLFDGRRTLRRSLVQGQLVADEHPTDQSQIPGGGAPIDSLPGLIRPNLRLEMQSGSSHFKREVRLLADDPNRPGLAGLRSTGFAQATEWWFDPGKDYLLVEKVSRQTGTSAARYIVTQTQQTPAGWWYPVAISTESTTFALDGEATVTRRVKRVLVDTDPVFDEAVFGPAAPAPGEEKAPVSNAVTPAVIAPSAPGMTGSVRDEQGRAVPGATVLLYYSHNHWGLGNKVAEQTRTDPNGRFLLTTPLAFEPRNSQDYYILFAAHPDYALGWQNIYEGREEQTYELTLTAPATRSITVTDHGDQPLAGVRVWLYSAGEQTSANPQFRDSFLIPTDMGLIGSLMDARGCATITNLPATACCFHATLDGYAQGLAFSGQNLIRLSPGANVSGRVATDTGFPVAGAVVRFYTGWMHNYFLAETDEQGCFALVDLPAQGWDTSPWGKSEGANGLYTVTVEHQDYAAPDLKLTLRPGERIDDLVIRVATETTLVTCLVLEEGTNTPVAGARIDGRNRMGSIERRSDPSGIVSVRVLRGPVALWFSSPPAGFYVSDEPLVSQADRVDFEAQGPAMNVVLKSPPLGGRLVNVSGTVCRLDGQAVADVVVYAAAGRFRTATAGSYVRPSGADADGRFELKEVPAGRPLYLYAESRDRSWAMAGVRDIPADPSQATPIVLVLQPTATAVAVVQEEGGSLVRNTALSVRPVVQGEQLWPAARTARTDELGILRMEGIVPGLTYHLRDVRFDEAGGRLPAGWDQWFERELVLLPLK
jgi:hypothetical protein